MPSSGEKKIVLVVDDNEAIRENLGECLEMEGYACWLARDADDALRRLAPEPRAPDVVLLDLKMPGMSAVDFVRALKQRPAWARIPVVLTTAALESDVPENLQYDALLPRPFDVGRLIELVRRVTHGAGASDLPPR